MADFLTNCMIDMNTTDVAAFTETFCQRCKQPTCERAKWSGDKFSSRVATQADRLLNPVQVDPSSSRYEHLQDFPSMMREAMMLEMSDARGDWEVPEVFVLDGKVKKTNLETLTPPPPPPRPPLVVPEEKYVNPFDDVEELPEEEEEDLPSEEPKVEGMRSTPAQIPTIGAAQVNKGNTQAPRGGMMIGGDPQRASEPAPDPWAIVEVNVRVVLPGAKIKMGG